MAFCPKCKSIIGMTDIICHKCGFDFPPSESMGENRSWEYSKFSDIALIIGGFLSLIYAMFTVVISCINLLSGNFLTGISGIIQALVFFSLSVVFLRIKNISKN